MSSKTVIGAEFRLDSADALASVGNVKKALKEANLALHAAQAEFGEMSAQAIKAAKQVANLRDALGDAKSLTEAFNPDKKFQAWTSALNGVVGGFAAVQGVMGLVGSESEEVEKALLKVQSAMAIMQGVDAVTDSIQAFKNLGVVIRASTIYQTAHNAVTAVAAAVTRLWSKSVDTTTASFARLKWAIAATGIGALLVALYFVIDAMDLFGDSTEEAAKAQEKLKAATESLNASISRQLDFLDRTRKLERLRLEAAGATAAQLEIFDQNTYKKRLKAAERGLQDAIDAGLNLQEATKVLNDVKEAEEARLLNNSIQRNKAAHDQKLKDQEEAHKKELEKLKAQEDKKNFLTSQPVTGSSAITDAIKAADKERNEAEDKKIEDAKVKGGLFVEVAQNVAGHLGMINGQITQNEADNAEAAKAIREQEVLHKAQMMQASASIMDSLAELAGRNTAAGKAFAIASTVISTYQAAQTAYASQFMPAPDPSSPIRGTIAAAAAIAGGLARVKNIMAVKVPNGGGGGGVSMPSGGAGGGAPLRPSYGSVTTTLDRNSINNMGNGAIKTYVLETDVTSSQEQIKRINRAARLG